MQYKLYCKGIVDTQGKLNVVKYFETLNNPFRCSSLAKLKRQVSVIGGKIRDSDWLWCDDIIQTSRNPEPRLVN